MSITEIRAERCLTKVQLTKERKKYYSVGKNVISMTLKNAVEVTKYLYLPLDELV